MRITAKVDYAVRAAIELARAYPTDGSRPTPLTRQTIAEAQDIPSKFLEHILADLKRSRLIGSVRGADGGYWLNRPPAEIAMADIIRAVEGPLADVRGIPPEELEYGGAAGALKPVWVAARASLRSVLEVVTVDAIAKGELPTDVETLLADPESWARR